MGSKTCCQGLTAFGFLIIIGSLLSNAFNISGIILSLAQSPPPITLPALTEAQETLEELLKKEFLYEDVINSEQPLLLL